MELCLISFAGIVHPLAKVLVCLIGAAALYCACFLFEDEQGRLQNRVEQLWISIDDRRRRGQALPLATKSAELVDRLLGKVLGQKLLSLRMAAMSTCLSIVVGQAFVLARGHTFFHAQFPFDSIRVLLVCIGALLAAIAIKWPDSTIMSVILFAPAVSSLFFFTHGLESIGGAIVGFTLSILSDLLFIFIVRLTLRRFTQTKRVSWLVLTIVSQVILIGIVGYLPYAAKIADIGDINNRMILEIIFDLRNFNISTVLFSMALVVLLIFLSVHRIFFTYFWPIVSRIFYPIAEFKIITNRKALVGISVACFTLISPPFSELLKKAVEIFK